MAINKRKILQSAQKHLQKGALEKALKDYQTLVKADPRDANLRLKIGDIELKRGRTDEAVAAYLKVAESFMKDGFDAKAVALYKQITKIDDKRADVLVPLADLYQRMGLQSDAMAALQTAADAHYRDGRKDDALDLLRRMAALDPSNTNSRLKVADLLRKEDRNEEAISEYEEVAAELDRQGAEEDRIRVLVRVLELAPDRVDLLASVARSRIDCGKFEAAEKTANLMIEQQPDDPDAWLLLGESRAALDRGPEGVDAYRRAAEIHRERGNDDIARDITQRFVAPATVEDRGAGDLADDELLGGTVEDLGAEAGTPEFDPNGMSLGSPLGESGADQSEANPSEADPSGASLPPLPQVDASEPEAEHEVDGDPEQLLAEASVYLRYGKHDRAIDSLRAIVRQDPTSVAAFAKLGEALEATGQTEHAITAYERGAEAATQNDDATAFEELRQSVAALDAGRAEALVPPEADPVSEPAVQAGEVAVETVDDGEIEVDVDVDPDDEMEADEHPAPSELSADEIEIELTLEEEAEDDAVEDELVPEFDLSGELELAVEDATVDPGEPELAVEAATVDPGEPEPESEEAESVEESEPELVAAEESLMADSADAADAVEIEISDPALDLAFEDDEDAQDDEPLETPDEVVGASASATTPAQMAEDLEEADFFYQQGMLDEARAVCERILAVAPGHPGALLRVGEIEAASGSDAEDAGVEVEIEDDSGLGADAASGLVDLTGDDVFDDADDSADEDEEFAPETDLGSDPDDDTGRITETVGPDGTDEDFAAGDAEEAEPAGIAEAEITARVVFEAPSHGDAGFDLAAQLSDALDLDEAAGPSVPRAAGTEGEGFEEVFAAFKQGVEGALDEGDFEAHYDLGIAYKEMGLFEDAIGEFQAAMGAEARQLPCLHMMGLCAFDLGRIVDAVAHLEQALGLPGIPEEQQIGLRFDLGRAYQGVGDLPRARAAFEAVQALDPEFPEVAEQLVALEEMSEPEEAAEEEADADEEAFENFDDLMADGPSGLEEADEDEEDPTYESFDDFLEADDGETEQDEPEEAGSAEPEEPELSEPVDEPEPEPDPVVETADEPEPPKKPGRRKKKISFV